jgi:hypothetical protein
MTDPKEIRILTLIGIEDTRLLTPQRWFNGQKDPRNLICPWDIRIFTSHWLQDIRILTSDWYKVYKDPYVSLI